MKEQLEQIKQQAIVDLDNATTPAQLEELRVKLLGKKGLLLQKVCAIILCR